MEVDHDTIKGNTVIIHLLLSFGDYQTFSQFPLIV